MNLKMSNDQRIKIDDLEDKLELNPGDPDCYWQLGNQYDDVDDHARSIKCYRRAVTSLRTELETNPKDPEKNNLMGLCFNDLCLPNQAIRYYQKAIHLKGDNYVYYYNLGIAEDTVDNHQAAIKAMERAIQLHPGHSDSYNQLCIMNENAGDYGQALHDEKAAIALEHQSGNREEPYYYYNLAVTEDKTGHCNTGITAIKHAIDLFSSDQKVPDCYKTCLQDLKDESTQNDDGLDEDNADYDYEYEHGEDELPYDPDVDYMKRLDQLIGLRPVKSVIKTFVHQVEINWIRTGKRQHRRMHLVFEGNPGTGKTTVAKLFCRILYQKHIIHRKRFTSINATQLVFSHYGKSAKQVRKVVRQSVGGVLFIDEAYYLAHRSDGNSVCQDEAMDAFLSAIDKHNDDLVVIMAGYTNKMEAMLRTSNPGLPSRFPVQDRISFPNYSGAECVKILEYFMHQNGFRIDNAKSRQLLKCYMNRYIMTKANDSRNTFANARTVKNVCDRLINCFSNRLRHRYSMYQLWGLRLKHDPVINEFTSVDVKNMFRCFSLGQAHLAIDELNELIGLKNVKSLVRSYVNFVKISKLRHGDVNPDGMDLVFEGNPGTGKTTVAKIFCKLLYQRGLVKSDNYVCTSAAELESSVVGRSAENLRRAFYKAKGGVLFIDEAYALLTTKQKGSNLIPELVDDLTEYKNSVVVILAGYPKAMERLLKFGNAGLNSRFAYRIRFHDYTKSECWRILEYDLKRDSLKLGSKKTRQSLKAGFLKLIDRLKSDHRFQFANARTVNQFCKVLKQNFANRLCSSASDTWLKTLRILHDRRLNTVTHGDVVKALKQCQGWCRHSNQSVIGFR